MSPDHIWEVALIAISATQREAYMATMYRIYEIADDGTRSVAGWGDHASAASALANVKRWGTIIAVIGDKEHDAYDLFLKPDKAPGITQIAIEPIRDGQSWPTC